MKKIRFIVIFGFLVSICVSCSAQTDTPNKYFSFGGSIGVIENNIVKFYTIDNNSKKWEIIPNMDMTLPTGYNSVFANNAFIDSNYIGVVVNDKIQFYRNENNAWVIIPDADMVLPDGYKNVFSLPNFNAASFVMLTPDYIPPAVDGIIGVVVNDKIQFYQNENNSWTIISDADMVLPDGYKNVFGLLNTIGIVINNRLQFYGESRGNWDILPEFELILPDGYKEVFCFGNIPAVVMPDRIQFYAEDRNGMVSIIPGLDYMIK